MEEIIKSCKKIEGYLLEYTLSANLIPRKSFYANLRKVFSREDWDIIRENVYLKDEYKCVVCGDNSYIEAHEDWIYNYEESTQMLNNIVSLCKMCHLHNHLGFAHLKIEQEELEEKPFILHWCNINNKTENDFVHYKFLVFQLWNLRNVFNWKIVDSKNIEIQLLKVENILEALD